MSVYETATENGVEHEHSTLPGAWEESDDEDLAFDELQGWEHPETGLTVRVRRERQPTQMSDPRTSRDDTGFTAVVRGDVEALLCYRLSSEDVARETAREFMGEYPDGEFEVPELDEQPTHGEAIEWGEN